MTSPETTVVQEIAAAVIARRTGSGADATTVVAAVRSVYEDLVTVLVPLISVAGVDALMARAFNLVQRDFAPVAVEDERPAEPFVKISLWLEGQDPGTVADAAAALFATFAGMLATLIGEPLTTRYLQKAWPEGFSRTRPKGKKT